MTEGNDDKAWRAMSDDEVRALAPFTLHVEGLTDEAVEQVRREYIEMLVRSVRQFVHHLDRVPSQQEAEMLAKAVVQYLNSVMIALLGGTGGAHATIQ